ncbi:MAG: aquaporin [Clostridiales bacterium]|nr:aquaporin [Clostridiales bacterium]
MDFKKLSAEFIGTFTLVFVGCGTAMKVGCDPIVGSGYLITALAFGLVIVGMAYCVGNVSGCHINPAVSLAFLIKGDLTVKDFIGYCIAQIIGAFAASFLLYAMFYPIGGITDMTGALGSNGLAGVNGSSLLGIIVEVILTFLFVLVILGVTSKKASHGSFGGLIIGLTLVMIHIIGIGFTGTSVNPARSIAPAVVSAIFIGTDPIKDLWIFIVAPLCGGALAAVVNKVWEK